MTPHSFPVVDRADVVSADVPTRLTNPSIPPSPYMTCPEAAAYLRTTVQGIYSLVKRGRVHPMPGRPGRLLVTREALDRYLSTRRR
jgi:excisionase family DNA binding protein